MPTCDLGDEQSFAVSQNETRADERSFSQWSGPQQCVEQYCLYSNPQFAGGQGIVVIAREETFPLLKEIHNTEYQIGNEAPAFHVREVPGKGLGIVAARKLDRGDSVMLQAPVLLIDLKFWDGIPTPRVNIMLDAAASLLPGHTQELFFTQMGHFGGHRVNDIITTNSFQAKIEGDERYSSNYPKASRFNHDCRPNVGYYIDSNLVHRSTAIRTIQPGEELTIAYFNVSKAQAERQRLAHEGWGFICRCAQCSLPKSLVTESDACLQRIQELEMKLRDPSAWMTMDTVRNLIKLYQDENLQVKLAGMFSVAALNANLLGLEEEAKKYAVLAIEAGLIEGGETLDVISMREMARDPAKYFTRSRGVE